jgi:flagellin-like protein
MMSKKGISPLIAVVLLIAFTVAVGGIHSIWLTTLSTTQTEKTEERFNKETACSTAHLKVKEVVYGNSSSGDSANVTVHYDRGLENLYNFTISFIDDDRKSYTVNRTSLTPQYSNTEGQRFTPGMIQTWNINITAYTNDLNTLTAAKLKSVYVNALCQTDYPVSGVCESGQSCMV